MSDPIQAHRWREIDLLLKRRQAKALERIAHALEKVAGAAPAYEVKFRAAAKEAFENAEPLWVDPLKPRDLWTPADWHWWRKTKENE